MSPLVLNNVWFRYSRSAGWVLRGVTFRLEECRAAYIMGPNGAGKTTLLRVAGLMAKPQRGSVVVDGVDYWSRPSIEARRRVVLVQSKPVLARGTLLENVALGLILRGVERSEALRRARNMLSALGLEDLGRIHYRRASAGQAQLAHVLRALIIDDAGYILLDEPTSYLDSEKREILARILREHLGGCKGVLIAGHDAEFAAMIGAEVYRLEDGVLSRGAHSSRASLRNADNSSH